jgi:hypothetical protein
MQFFQPIIITIMSDNAVVAQSVKWLSGSGLIPAQGATTVPGVGPTISD